MFEKKGYIGNKMSVRASQAYENDIMPISKWTKKALVSRILEINNKLDEKLLNKISAKKLKDEFLFQESYHHTGKFYNRTNFYEVNKKYCSNTKNEDLQEIIDEINYKKSEKAKIEDLIWDLEHKLIEIQWFIDSNKTLENSKDGTERYAAHMTLNGIKNKDIFNAENLNQLKNETEKQIDELKEKFSKM